MYGLVNKAVEQLVTEQFGIEKWNAIRAKAGFQESEFVNMQSYPDKVTYDLVAAASEILNVPAEKLLEAFGEYWILYTAKEGYEEFLEMGGKSVKEFLQNLNNLHGRVGSMFKDLQPPVFRCSDILEDSLRLHYYSKRPGLAPMIVGLVKGLGKRFGEQVEVSQLKDKGEGSDHCEFEIKFG